MENMRKNEIDIKQFPFVEVNQFKKAPFCVDGRAGKVDDYDLPYGPYPQMLGGSLMPVVLEWLINQPENRLEEVLSNVFGKLKKFNYPLGVHTSTHAHESWSDCGFADNLRGILTVFQDNFEEIKNQLNNLGISFEEETDKEVKKRFKKVNLNQIPTGQQLIELAQHQGAQKQVLTGEHKEVAAIVNLRQGLTLDVDQNQKKQAFNFDFWLIEEIGEKFGWRSDLRKLLSLGLYVATEMVLVEQKGKPRLPILINQ